MKKRNKQENVRFSQHKDGKNNVDFDFKCLKFHLKFIRKRQQPAPASQQVTESWVNDLYVLSTFRSNNQVLC